MKTIHWFVFIVLGAIWSSSFLWIKIGVQEIGPMALVAFRMFFGALAAVLIGIYLKVEWPRDWKTWGIFVILGPTSLAIPIFLISWGEQTIDATSPPFSMSRCRCLPLSSRTKRRNVADGLSLPQQCPFPTGLR